MWTAASTSQSYFSCSRSREGWHAGPPASRRATRYFQIKVLAHHSPRAAAGSPYPLSPKGGSEHTVFLFCTSQGAKADLARVRPGDREAGDALGGEDRPRAGTAAGPNLTGLLQDRPHRASRLSFIFRRQLLQLGLPFLEDTGQAQCDHTPGGPRIQEGFPRSWSLGSGDRRPESQGWSSGCVTPNTLGHSRPSGGERRGPFLKPLMAAWATRQSSGRLKFTSPDLRNTLGVEGRSRKGPGDGGPSCLKRTENQQGTKPPQPVEPLRPGRGPGGTPKPQRKQARVPQTPGASERQRVGLGALLGTLFKRVRWPRVWRSRKTLDLLWRGRRLGGHVGWGPA